jgi:hypothetical protein
MAPVVTTNSDTVSHSDWLSCKYKFQPFDYVYSAVCRAIYG